MKKIDILLDNAWSKKVKEIGKCEYCGSPDKLNAHHIYGKRNMSVRWDIENGICLCENHHLFDSDFSAHLTPDKFMEWINRPNLLLKAHETKKWCLFEKEELLKELK